MPPTPPPDEAELPEPFAALVFDYDEAIADGSIVVPGSSGRETVTDVLPEPLRAAVDCLSLLERERQRRSASDKTSCEPRAVTQNESHFGRFTILRELGRGGQAVVFLARDPTLNRLVALKVPRPDVLMTPTMRRRFLREGKAAAQLSHPNLVTVYEAGELGPICYLTQAYCAGINLAEWLARQGTVSVTVAARIVADLADGVAHAHDRGVLHRDLKPSNVLLETHAESGGANGPHSPRLPDRINFVPKLTDFGLAKVLEPDGDETVTGAIVGTAFYMSPEQACGRHDAIGPATDVYGLGAILYELLVGSVVFRGNSHVDTLRKVASEEPRAPRSLRSDLPRDLEAICLRCIEKQPQLRYASAAHLADDLRRFLRGEPTFARPVRLHERAVKWIRRRPSAAALFCVSALAITLLAASSTWYSIRLSRSLATSQASALRAREQLYASDIARAQEALNRHNAHDAIQILDGLRPAEGEDDLRGIAWHYLWSTIHDYQREFLGHEGDVYGVAASPDGSSWATAGKDGTVRLWSTDGQPQTTLTGHVGEVNCVSFAPDSSMLASGGDDGTIRLWDIPSGKLLRILRGHTDHLTTTCFSPDGTRLASSAIDQTIRLWRSSDGAELASAQASDSLVRSVAYSPDGTRLVSVGDRKFVQVWDIEGEELNESLQIQTNLRPHVAEFCSEGREIVLGYDTGELSTFDVGTGDEVDRLQSPHKDGIVALALDPSQTLMASASKDGTATIWNLAERRLLKSVRGQRDRLWSVAFAIDADLLATASADGTVRLADFDRNMHAAQDQGLRSYRELADLYPMDFNISADGQLAAIGGNYGELAVYNLESQAITARLSPRDLRVGQVLMTPNRRTVISLTHGPAERVALRVTDTSTDRVLFTRSNDPETRSLALATDGSWLAIGQSDGCVEILETRTWSTLQKLRAPGPVTKLRVSPDGHSLAVLRGPLLEVWNTKTWSKRCDDSQLGMAFSDASFSLDGNILATAESNRTIGLRETATGKLLGTLIGHHDAVEQILFSPDGTTLATVGVERRSVYLWDIRTHRQLIELPLPPQGFIDVDAISFDPDGKALYGLITRKSGTGHLISWRFDLGAGHERAATE